MHFTLLQREKKYHGKIVDLTVDHLQYPSGTQTLREIVEHPGGAAVVALFDNQDVLLIQQYRHPFGKTVVELPAGKLDKNENPLLCAQRELREETGYAAKQWDVLTSLYTTPGFCNEIIHLFLARELFPHADGQALEEGEASISLRRVPFVDVLAMIDAKEIVDGKSIAGILLAARILGIS